ncbi:hypothetical protein IFM89_037172 [Coptis chinensis]|uniref:MORF/ORRM1/DAG-like MORF domain-containing protein n=1 Tax=Coptis chinensis TaxID=261450 RepID=A0A835I920_9MAGN|nr:hypothetical protein IFM89_037172 [Coptis chinensis]
MYICVLRTNGLEFGSEKALFDYYVKLLSEVVGSQIDAVATEKLKDFPVVYNVIEDIYYHCSKPKLEWDLDHWLINIKCPEGGFATRTEALGCCIEVLAKALKKKREKIYVIWSIKPFGFGAEIGEEASNKLKGLSGVQVGDPDYVFIKGREVRSASEFTAINLNHELEDIFRYQLLSEPNPEWNFDCWLIHIKLPIGGCSTEQETLNLCIKMLAKIPFGFAAEVDENTSEKLKDLTDVSLPGRQSGAKEWRITRSEWVLIRMIPTVVLHAQSVDVWTSMLVAVTGHFILCFRSSSTKAFSNSDIITILGGVKRLLGDLSKTSFRVRRSSIDSNSISSKLSVHEMMPSLAELLVTLSLKTELEINGKLNIWLAGDPVKTSIALPIALDILDEIIGDLNYGGNLTKDSLSLPLLKSDRLSSGHDYLTVSGFALDTSICKAVIDMYSKCGRIDCAQEVFNRMPNRDINSWNSMVAGYGIHGLGREALWLFHDLQNEGPKPNYVTFICLLSACSHSSLVRLLA